MSRKISGRRHRASKRNRELLITTIFIAIAIFGTYGIFYGIGFALNNPRPFAVVEGTSMLPNYREYDLVIVQGVVPSTLKVGDVIVFQQPGHSQNLIIHRIKEIITSNTQPVFRTKGDNNASPDPWLVQANNVIGKVIYQISSIGIVFLTLSTPVLGNLTLGNLLAIILMALLIFLVYITPVKQKKRKLKSLLDRDLI